MFANLWSKIAAIIRGLVVGLAVLVVVDVLVLGPDTTFVYVAGTACGFVAFMWQLISAWPEPQKDPVDEPGGWRVDGPEDAQQSTVTSQPWDLIRRHRWPVVLIVLSSIFLTGLLLERNREAKIGVAGQNRATTISQSWEPDWVTVRYRPTAVDVGAPYFERLGRADSTLVYAAWYDDEANYMVINLAGTNYHYCGFPRSAWIALQTAGSMGRHYQSNIKGRYDCRVHFVPTYR